MKLKQIYDSFSHNERLVFWGALIVFLATFAVTTTSYIQENTLSVPKTGGEFREGIVGQPIFINPVVPVSQTDRDLSRLVFSNAEDIAESVKITENNHVYNLRIKENILWQDGEKLTTDDIIFTVQTIQNPATNSTLLTSFQGVSVERVSELEMKFVLQIPYALFEQDNLKNLFIIPKHIFADTPVENLGLSDFRLEPIGSGPYKVSGYKKDEKGIITAMNLEKNKSYFGHRPYIPEMTFKFYLNTAELLEGFNSGQIDGFGLSNAESLGEIKLRHNITYLPSLRYYAVFINQSSSNKNLIDLKTRRALAKVVDREKMTEEIFGSHATPLYGPTTLTEKPDYPVDTTLLKDIQLNITVPEEPFLVKTANALKNTWEGYGAKVTLRILPLKNILEDVSRTLDYELLLFGNTVSVGEDLFAFWHSSRRSYPEQNLALYQNKNVDTELETYRKIFVDAERLKKLGKISDLIAFDTPAVFLYSPDYLYISTPNLGGLDPAKTVSTASDRFADVTKWYVETKRVFK